MRRKIRKISILAVTDSSSKPLSRELINVLRGNHSSPADSRANWLHMGNTKQKRLFQSGTDFICFLLFNIYLIAPKYLKRNCCMPHPINSIKTSVQFCFTWWFLSSKEGAWCVGKAMSLTVTCTYTHLLSATWNLLGWTVTFEELWMPLGWLPTAPSKNSGKVGKGTKGSGFREPLGSLRQQHHHHLELIRNAKPQDPPRTSWFRKSEVGPSHLCCD